MFGCKKRRNRRMSDREFEALMCRMLSNPNIEDEIRLPEYLSKC